MKRPSYEKVIRQGLREAVTRASGSLPEGSELSIAMSIAIGAEACTTMRAFLKVMENIPKLSIESFVETGWGEEANANTNR